MILGIGIDLEEVDRLSKSIEKFGDRFLERIFTAGEIAFCRGKANANERFAARFAAKEAAFKALAGSESARLIGWKDIEVISRPGHAPELVLHGRAQQRADVLGVRRHWLTLSHTDTTAGAVVVLEAD